MLGYRSLILSPTMRVEGVGCNPLHSSLVGGNRVRLHLSLEAVDLSSQIYLPVGVSHSNRVIYLLLVSLPPEKHRGGGGGKNENYYFFCTSLLRKLFVRPLNILVGYPMKICG
jgi:hypothetical protein